MFTLISLAFVLFFAYAASMRSDPLRGATNMHERFFASIIISVMFFLSLQLNNVGFTFGLASNFIAGCIQIVIGSIVGCVLIFFLSFFQSYEGAKPPSDAVH